MDSSMILQTVTWLDFWRLLQIDHRKFNPIHWVKVEGDSFI